MGKAVPWLTLAAVATALLAISFIWPEVLSDRNTFLKNFVNHELLATLGFIAAVTLASSASLHLELNKLEDATEQAFPRTRASVRKCAYSLLALLALAIVLVIVKPMWPEEHLEKRSLANSLAILILIFNLHVLYALTRTVFAIPTAAKIREMQDERSNARRG